MDDLYDDEEYIPTELEMYQDWVAQHSSKKVPSDQKLAWALLGLTAEVGELTELCEKALRKEGWVDYGSEHWKDELGDVLWYVAAVCNVLQLSLDDVLDNNMVKINARIYGKVAQED